MAAPSDSAMRYSKFKIFFELRGKSNNTRGPGECATTATLTLINLNKVRKHKTFNKTGALVNELQAIVTYQKSDSKRNIRISEYKRNIGNLDEE